MVTCALARFEQILSVNDGSRDSVKQINSEHRPGDQDATVRAAWRIVSLAGQFDQAGPGSQPASGWRRISRYADTVQAAIPPFDAVPFDLGSLWMPTG